MQWDQSRLDALGIDCVKFGREFSIDDAVLGILTTRPTLCARLNTFIAGEADTGSGSYVSDDHRALAALLATSCESNPDLAKNLRDLNLTDQHISHDNEKAIKKLQKAHKSLIIRTGETKGDHAWEWNVDVGPDVVYVKGKMEFFKPETYSYYRLLTFGDGKT
ncbi:hypothetical protein HHX47_DHR4001006 [Lentinula edodes]|nr:hypothetical protein HHX47_DHR4001006 [Lentinula edodes]